ncbi:uncharacterized protein LOC130628989 [Hydractinia symbiolongicarpus]|uniref:uncharacterized protein LOC130628989 n=1 Tax=Hydractinia symbiolongicarpus TaxID=13093 RepID=UPI00254E33DB|nr:uncharacterized protein LOC130628989 [Hydractinia symbiolongicarpus]
MTGLKVSPEPAPNFTTAREVLGIAWPLHYIFFGIFFAIFFFYTLINIINLLRSEMFQRRKIFLFINGMLCFLCFVMASSLFLDPYDSGEHFEEINFHGIVFTIVGLRVPCITASFSLTQISLLEATKLQLYSKKLQSYTFISFVIGFHFILVFTVDVILTVFAGTIVFLLVCQVFFLFIGVVMSATSIYSGLKVISHYSQSKITLQQHNQFDMESFRKNNPSKIASEVTSPHIFKKPTKSSDIKQVIFKINPCERLPP